MSMRSDSDSFFDAFDDAEGIGGAELLPPFAEYPTRAAKITSATTRDRRIDFRNCAFMANDPSSGPAPQGELSIPTITCVLSPALLHEPAHWIDQRDGHHAASGGSKPTLLWPKWLEDVGATDVMVTEDLGGRTPT